MTTNMTQAERILEVLKFEKGEWVNGQYFLRTMMLSQYHARIKELQMNKKNRYQYEGVIEASPFFDRFGFKSYRLGKVTLTEEQRQAVEKINAIPAKEKDERSPNDNGLF